MSSLDFLLLIILFGFLFFGFWFGLIHMIGAVLGTIVGAWLAGHYYPLITSLVETFVGQQGNWVSALAFVVILVVVNRLVGFFFFQISKAFNVVSAAPYLRTIDRFLGGVLGFLEGALVIGISLYFISRLNLPATYESAIAASWVAQKLIAFGDVLAPLLPDIIRTLQPFASS